MYAVDVCSESEWFVFGRWTKGFLDRTKHMVSPTYSQRCLVSVCISNAPLDVCSESEWFVFGRWTEGFLDRRKHIVSPAYSPTVARECLHIKYAPLDVCRKSEWFVFGRLTEGFLDRIKLTVSPTYSPTVARECLHIKCTVGRMQGIRMICIPNELQWVHTESVEDVREVGYI